MAQFVTRDTNNVETFRFDQSIVRLNNRVDASGSGSVNIPSDMQGTPMFVLHSSNLVDQSHPEYMTADAYLDGRTVRWSNQPPGTVIEYGAF